MYASSVMIIIPGKSNSKVVTLQHHNNIIYYIAVSINCISIITLVIKIGYFQHEADSLTNYIHLKPNSWSVITSVSLVYT